jgi:hypothetical protein
VAPTRHPEPERAIQAALEDYTRDVAAALTRLNTRLATVVQTYEADRDTLAKIRELTRG